MHLNRRDVMKLGGLGAVGAAATTFLPSGQGVGASTLSTLDPRFMPVPFETRFVRPPIARVDHRDRLPNGQLIDCYMIKAGVVDVPLLRGGRTTRMFAYNGSVPGPTLKIRRGNRIRMRVRNHLPASHPTLGYEPTTSTHLHGSASLPQYDGYASDVTHPGFMKEYQYPNFQPARTLWYHDHGAHHTAENVFQGLAAQYHLSDKAERGLLPQGQYDVPITVMDVGFNAEGQLLFDDRGHSGTFGDVLLVNGRPWPVMKVKRRVYRFRLLAASVSRSYRWRLGPGYPMHVVATDGGLMPHTQTVSELRQGMAERYEVLVDFSRFRPGTRIVLHNLSNDNNRDYEHTDKVMAFDVVDDPFDKRDPTWNRIPGRLVDSHVMNLRPRQAVARRTLRVARSNGLWTINGQTWDDVVASNYQLLVANPSLGDVEIWRIVNNSGGWFHPVHIHLVDFKILSRNGQPPQPFERGPKDVVYVGENESVDLIMKFEHQRGRYMVHCHNLTHEDHDMMVQFAVGWKPGDPDRNDPIDADRPEFDDLPG